LKKEFREIIPDAEVKLSIANKSFTVIGEAGTGVFPVYKDKLTIYQALAMSGDLKLSGDFRHVKILREEEGKTEILEFDIRPASVIESKYYYVYPNDIIYVQRASSSFFKVNNYSSFLGLISSSLSLLFSVLYYIKL
jgi:polysaccharide export outer membrane protein